MKHEIRRSASRVIAWQESFCTGIAAVDADHRRLFAMAHLLDVGNAALTLADLKTYAVEHFVREEHLMEETRFPDRAEHRRQHDHFALRIANFSSPDANWTAERVEQLRTFVNAWLQSHILIHDLAFGRWHAVATYVSSAPALLWTYPLTAK
jgi:hemerythrin